ncbi:MAG: signal transduction histidine kinase [Flavobacteriaceae bacterium]|jgi:signal transduction histidine kinase|uniref:hypothetical protein n=1 Tax=Candidatus Marifrigoribacter sp. Uisw_064 TaxID=3230970 RepID=UPI003AEC9AC2
MSEKSIKTNDYHLDNVAHEFRTPITLILASLEDTLCDNIDKKTKSNLLVIQRSAMHFKSLFLRINNY